MLVSFSIEGCIAVMGAISGADGSSIGDLGDCFTSLVMYDDPSPRWSDIQEGKESKSDGLTSGL